MTATLSAASRGAQPVFAEITTTARVAAATTEMSIKVRIAEATTSATEPVPTAAPIAPTERSAVDFIDAESRTIGCVIA